MGAEHAKIKLEKKALSESPNSSAPIICTFYPNYLRGQCSNQNIESLRLKKNGHNTDVILGLNNKIELAPMQVVEPKNSNNELGADNESKHVNIGNN